MPVTNPNYRQVPHYRHADFQGNTTMVTDASGTLEQHTGYYPYGEPWREPTGQPYLYGGKERMRDGALNDYDFTARRLNSALCLWSTPDPCALDYGSLNPHIYCAANPIRFTDPTGCRFTDGSMKYVNSYISEIFSKLNKNDEKIKDQKAKLAKGELRDRQIKKINKNIQKLEKENSSLYEALGELFLLNISSQEYNIMQNSSLNYERENTFIERSGTSYNSETGQVDIIVCNNDIYHIAHELKHAYQFEVGSMSLGYGPRSGEPFYDYEDEREAYKRGALFGQIPELSYYTQLQKDQHSVYNDLGENIYNNPNALQKYVEKFEFVFRFRGRTYKSSKKRR